MSNSQIYNPTIFGVNFKVIITATLLLNAFLMISNAIVYEKSDRLNTLDICHEDLHNYALFVIVFSSILVILSTTTLILINKNYTPTNSFLFKAVYWCLSSCFLGSLIFNLFATFAWLPHQTEVGAPPYEVVECKDDFYVIMIIDSIVISGLCGIPYFLYQIYKLVVYYQNFRALSGENAV